MTQGYDKQTLAHEISTLKRVVYFSDYIEVLSLVGQNSMGAYALLDISSYVSATAEVGIFQIYLHPNSSTYWLGALSSNPAVATKHHLVLYANEINQWRTSFGLQKLSSDQKVYYYIFAPAGGPPGLTTNVILRFYGYIEPA